MKTISYAERAAAGIDKARIEYARAKEIIATRKWTPEEESAPHGWLKAIIEEIKRGRETYMMEVMAIMRGRIGANKKALAFVGGAQ